LDVVPWKHISQALGESMAPIPLFKVRNLVKLFFFLGQLGQGSRTKLHKDGCKIPCGNVDKLPKENMTSIHVKEMFRHNLKTIKQPMSP